MSESAWCPDCGTELPLDRAIEGLCPQCLLSLALRDPGPDLDELETLDGPYPGLRNDLMPLLDVVWIDADADQAGLDLVLERKKRDLSLVDAVSFVVMREQRLEHAFAFDSHFEDEGFSLLR